MDAFYYTIRSSNPCTHCLSKHVERVKRSARREKCTVYVPCFNEPVQDVHVCMLEPKGVYKEE